MKEVLDKTSRKDVELWVAVWNAKHEDEEKSGITQTFCQSMQSKEGGM